MQLRLIDNFKYYTAPTVESLRLQEKIDTLQTDLAQFDEKLRAAGIVQIYAFGPVVNGDAGPESDIDIAVLIPTTYTNMQVEAVRTLSEVFKEIYPRHIFAVYLPKTGKYFKPTPSTLEIHTIFNNSISELSYVEKGACQVLWQAQALEEP